MNSAARQELTGACIIAQSGGPTSVINASVFGAVRAALDCPQITQVLGAEYGIKGVLNDRLIDFGQEDPKELEYLLNTPSSELGSVRYKLKDPEDDATDYRRILEIFRKYDVRYFFLIGGNDSMDTCNKVSRFMASSGYECRIIGIPKTIDNDLFGTDHCPGYASAAKFIATTCMEIYKDATVYETGMVTVIEIMGRHAGWLTAAASLASMKGCGPDLIFLPERVFSMEYFLRRVKEIYAVKRNVIAAVSEGIHDSEGRFISEYASSSQEKDSFGHTQLGGVAAILADAAKRETGAKVRGIELSLLQRCAAHCASETDVIEAAEAGRRAVLGAVGGVTGKMVAFRRGEGDRYVCHMDLIDLDKVANYEKKFPDEWINGSGDGILPAFYDYALPLIQGDRKIPTEDALPRFARLKKVFVE
ncbi:MAG: 6-phosphofructokinase [Clostridiales bacterium]|jgi:6-phosphofructokinase|nr:6-phosphofructokinase [Clostridiales bacterium]